MRVLLLFKVENNFIPNISKRKLASYFNCTLLNYFFINECLSIRITSRKLKSAYFFSLVGFFLYSISKN